MSTSPGTSRAVRSDSLRNREALLASARETFAEYGLNASLQQVARTAGVAIGTLYRHFPTRDDLLVAVFAEKLRIVADTGERALAHWCTMLMSVAVRLLMHPRCRLVIARLA